MPFKPTSDKDRFGKVQLGGGRPGKVFARSLPAVSESSSSHPGRNGEDAMGTHTELHTRPERKGGRILRYPATPKAGCQSLIGQRVRRGRGNIRVYGHRPPGFQARWGRLQAWLSVKFHLSAVLISGEMLDAGLRGVRAHTCERVGKSKKRPH